MNRIELWTDRIVVERIFPEVILQPEKDAVLFPWCPVPAARYQCVIRCAAALRQEMHSAGHTRAQAVWSYKLLSTAKRVREAPIHGSTSAWRAVIEGKNLPVEHIGGGSGTEL